ncbi:MAG: hypothetical protein AAF568_11880 [Pseudomonadota bacterium]
MADPTRRIDLRHGDFAVSVQGFEDPTKPIRMLIRALQRTIEETPEFSNVAFSADDAVVEEILGKLAAEEGVEDGFEAVPGLILVRRAGVEAVPTSVEETEEEAPEESSDGLAAVAALGVAGAIAADASADEAPVDEAPEEFAPVDEAPEEFAAAEESVESEEAFASEAEPEL